MAVRAGRELVHSLPDVIRARRAFPAPGTERRWALGLLEPVLSLHEGLWHDEQSVAESSNERRRLRTVLFTADSSRTLLALCEGLCTVVGVVVPADPSAPVPSQHSTWRRLKFEFFRSFEAPTALESVASELRVPLVRTWRLDDPKLLTLLERLEPDVFVVAGYPEIFRESLLKLPKHGCINVHASLLPRYRGPQPIAQALLHGEPFTGVTLHLMDAKIDTGPILAQDIVPILQTDTVYSLAARIFELGGRILLDVLEKLALGSLRPRAQDSRRASYFRRLAPDAGQVDWSQPAARIRNLTRLSPWLQVYSKVGKARLVLKACRPRDSGSGQETTDPSTSPGQIVARIGKSLVVQTGSGQLVVEDYALEGSRLSRFRARGKLRVGAVLGGNPGPVKEPREATSGSPRSPSSA